MDIPNFQIINLLDTGKDQAIMKMFILTYGLPIVQTINTVVTRRNLNFGYCRSAKSEVHCPIRHRADHRVKTQVRQPEIRARTLELYAG